MSQKPLVDIAEAMLDVIEEADANLNRSADQRIKAALSAATPLGSRPPAE